MKLININRELVSAILILTLLTACQDKPAGPIQEDFGLSVRVQSLDYAGVGIWGSTAELGVIVTSPGGNEIIDWNVPYTTVINTGANLLVPSDKPISMPEDGSKADIITYCPYSAEIMEGSTTCHINLKDQEKRNPEILMTGRAADCSSTINSATVTLKPVYSKLNVRLKMEYMTKASEDEVSIRLANVPLEADVDVMTGEYVSYGEHDTTLLIRPDRTVHSYESVLPAHGVAKNAQLIISLITGDENIGLMNHIKEFEPNRQYDLEIEVTPEGVNATLVAMSDFYVSDWHTDEEDIYENINKQK